MESFRYAIKSAKNKNSQCHDIVHLSVRCKCPRVYAQPNIVKYTSHAHMYVHTKLMAKSVTTIIILLLCSVNGTDMCRPTSHMYSAASRLNDSTGIISRRFVMTSNGGFNTD